MAGGGGTSMPPALTLDLDPPTPLVCDIGNGEHHDDDYFILMRFRCNVPVIDQKID